MGKVLSVNNMSATLLLEPASQAEQAEAATPLERAEQALADRNLSVLHAALRDLAEEIGAKPKSSDYEEKADFKEALDAYFDAKKQLGSLLRAATAAGFALRETYSASISKSGSVSIAYRQAVSVKPSFAKLRI